MTQDNTKEDPRIREEAVKEKIRAAFADVPYPGDMHLVDMDPGEFNFEEKDLLRAFRGKNWRDLTLKELHNTGQAFFTAEGYHFFLPAYMLASIEEYKDADVLPDDTIWGLDPDFNAESGRTEKFEKALVRLTPAQRDAIREFLEFMRDVHGEDFAYSHIDFGRLIEFYK